ncbi:NDR1/HIN1-like protein 6 [Diospyros lotus]|uniref:NDR1/HIN1-like protein 6 n=1 Tax=Diospyros lotus TaxID=55363 RepID=UPI0022514667|nr:NDR1/HIN1-like protein 6 [Diospyros lotus]
MSSAPPPPYVMLSDNNGGLRPPPYRRNIPRYHGPGGGGGGGYPKKGGGGSCCLKCICCCYCLLFLTIFILAGITIYLYTFFNPKMPNYQVNGLNVTTFSLQQDFSLLTEFVVSVRAENPNDRIGFIYGRDSAAVVTYRDSKLCSGKLPSFEQGHNNVTLMNVTMKGKSEFGNGLQEALMQNKNSGKIPLLVQVKVPVSVVVADSPLRQFLVFVNCSLVVDNLSPNKKIRILSSEYTLHFAF